MRLRFTDDVSVLAIRISAGRSDRSAADRPFSAARSDKHRPILFALHEGKCVRFSFATDWRSIVTNFETRFRKPSKLFNSIEQSIGWEASGENGKSHAIA